jgi:hypothetical protein
MRLTLTRLQLDPDVTIGSLDADGDWVAWTCEDTVRPQGVKISGQTAIPAGRYTVIINQSQRFQRLLPLLLDVPGFSGVRIHPGNTAADTEGCILPGLDRLAKSVGRSRRAFDGLFARMQEAARKGEPITLEIIT